MLLCNHLTIGYGAKVIQRDLSFSLESGEMVCMLGRNGCGKSTLLRTLAGLQPALGGEFRLGEAGNPSKTVALVLSSDEAIERTTVHDVVAMGRYPYTSLLGRLTPYDEQVIEEALAAVGVEEQGTKNKEPRAKTFLESPFMAHSDGEKQRILIAKALAQQTPIILLDEPTAHLDLPNRIRVLQLLRSLAHNEGKTILISTHELDLAVRLSDRILLMSPQQSIQLATPQELIAADAFTQAFGLNPFDLFR
ncbi:MAG: ABC transporter ATP-binding protein [Paludibacteraceae bacterium]|nr:ABC transporter ATP-binding protein [Paludibacteraceae bacterium]